MLTDFYKVSLGPSLWNCGAGPTVSFCCVVATKGSLTEQAKGRQGRSLLPGTGTFAELPSNSI